MWIEGLRIDAAERIFGVRLNVWTSIVVFLLAVGWMLTHRRPRETDLYLPGRQPRRAAGSSGAGDSSAAGSSEAGDGAPGDDPSGEKVSLRKSDPSRSPPDD